eukprot:GEMP01040685.1.p1 GENE.GEMP01040685.1~~GEMP01040685.1.p1  ORF type:complete len:337 (+),score=90.04 GEMP01040685.1:95-1105(+)
MGNALQKSLKEKEALGDPATVCNAALSSVCRQLNLRVLAHHTAQNESTAAAVSEQINTINVDGLGWMRPIAVEYQWQYTIDVLETSAICVNTPELSSVCFEVAQIAESFYWIALGSSRGNVDQKVYSNLKAKIGIGRSGVKRHKKMGETLKMYCAVLDNIEESLDATMPMDGLTGTGFVEKLNVAKEMRKMPVDEAKKKKKWKKLLRKYHPDKQLDSAKRRDSTRIFQFMQSAKETSEVKEFHSPAPQNGNDKPHAHFQGMANPTVQTSTKPKRRSVGCCLASPEREDNQTRTKLSSQADGSKPISKTNEQMSKNAERPRKTSDVSSMSLALVVQN